MNTVTISPDGSLCATGSRDGKVILSDLREKHVVHEYKAEAAVNQLLFSPRHYWLAAATDDSILIWDLEKKVLLAKETLEEAKNGLPTVMSLCWSPDGTKLFAGLMDGRIFTYGVQAATQQQ